MKFLTTIQEKLEDTYGASTGLDVLDFVKTAPGVPGLAKLLVEQVRGPDDEGGTATTDINLALLFDRDLLEAWEHSNHIRAFSVPFEEVSHFVYLSFNHNRGRNITELEMEIQSEIDRILLAFHGGFSLPKNGEENFLHELLLDVYKSARHEESRKVAAAFVKRLALGNPHAWTEAEFKKLRQFFHSDLSEKMRLAFE